VPLRSSQHTLRRPIFCSGVGLHSGKEVSLTLRPARPNTGIVFRRVDLPGRPTIAVSADNVSPSPLCTMLHDSETDAAVMTVEHVLAALSALGVDNVLCDLDAVEVPILDGSSEPFVFLIESAGLRAQSASRRYLKVLRPVEYRDGNKVARLEPADAFYLDARISFQDIAIGEQQATLMLSPYAFKAELAAARTFTCAKDITQMRAAGLALGGSLDNAVVVDGARVLNPEGFRMHEECVRHKLLDAVGDLALAGYPLLARYTGVKAGHYMHYRLVEALLSDSENYAILGSGDTAPVSYRLFEVDTAVRLHAA
jgi:UDP-3-O-[3-hydroxymyristoyl] N-acetylglucosamine deacetylase